MPVTRFMKSPMTGVEKAMEPFSTPVFRDAENLLAYGVGTQERNAALRAADIADGERPKYPSAIADSQSP